jgi:hypothetical protein
MVNPSTLVTNALGTGLGIPPGRIFAESLHDTDVMKRSTPSNAGAAIQSQ